MTSDGIVISESLGRVIDVFNSDLLFIYDCFVIICVYYLDLSRT